MPFIVNVPRYALQNGDHKYASPCVLIQITDPGTDFIKPFHEFVEIYRFEFFDIDGTETGVLSELSEYAFSADDANRIANILQNALKNDYNVVCSCMMGLCRSGAVADVAHLLGFQDTEMPRMPNVLVKNRLKKALGLEVDYNEVFKFQLPEWE